MSGYNAPIDRVYRQPGHMDYPTATVPRNYHYGPPGGYDDYRSGPPSETYASLNRGARMDDRYRCFIIFTIVAVMHSENFIMVVCSPYAAELYNAAF